MNKKNFKIHTIKEKRRNKNEENYEQEEKN